VGVVGAAGEPVTGIALARMFAEGVLDGWRGPGVRLEAVGFGIRHVRGCRRHASMDLARDGACWVATLRCSSCGAVGTEGQWANRANL